MKWVTVVQLFPRKRALAVREQVWLLWEQGLRQFEIARGAGVSRTTVSRYCTEYEVRKVIREQGY